MNNASSSLAIACLRSRLPNRHKGHYAIRQFSLSLAEKYPLNGVDFDLRFVGLSTRGWQAARVILQGLWGETSGVSSSRLFAAGSLVRGRLLSFAKP